MTLTSHDGAKLIPFAEVGRQVMGCSHRNADGYPLEIIGLDIRPESTAVWLWDGLQTHSEMLYPDAYLAVEP